MQLKHIISYCFLTSVILISNIVSSGAYFTDRAVISKTIIIKKQDDTTISELDENLIFDENINSKKMINDDVIIDTEFVNDFKERENNIK